MTDDPFDIPDFLNRRKGNPMTNIVTAAGAPETKTAEPAIVTMTMPAAATLAVLSGLPPEAMTAEPGAAIRVDSLGNIIKDIPLATPKAPRQKRTSAFKVAIEGYVTYNDADPADMARAAALVAEGDVLKLAVHMTDVTVSQTHGRFKGIGG